MVGGLGRVVVIALGARLLLLGLIGTALVILPAALVRVAAIIITGRS